MPRASRVAHREKRSTVRRVRHLEAEGLLQPRHANRVSREREQWPRDREPERVRRRAAPPHAPPELPKAVSGDRGRDPGTDPGATDSRTAPTIDRSGHRSQPGDLTMSL